MLRLASGTAWEKRHVNVIHLLAEIGWRTRREIKSVGRQTSRRRVESEACCWWYSLPPVAICFGHLMLSITLMLMLMVMVMVMMLIEVEMTTGGEETKTRRTRSRSRGPAKEEKTVKIPSQQVLHSISFTNICFPFPFLRLCSSFPRFLLTMVLIGIVIEPIGKDGTWIRWRQRQWQGSLPSFLSLPSPSTIIAGLLSFSLLLLLVADQSNHSSLLVLKDWEEFPYIASSTKSIREEKSWRWSIPIQDE
jgi:hypothetical protein